MSRRITLLIDNDLVKKLRLLQAKQISKHQTSYSFDKIVNETLRKVLDK